MMGNFVITPSVSIGQLPGQGLSCREVVTKIISVIQKGYIEGFLQEVNLHNGCMSEIAHFATTPYYVDRAVCPNSQNS